MSSYGVKDVLGVFESIWQYVYADEACNFCEAVEERGISSQSEFTILILLLL